MPSHLRPRPGTASAVDRLSIGRLVGEQCNFDQSSIVARMSSRAMQNGRSWVKKRNLGQKNETRAEKTGFSALFLSVSIEREGGIRKIFSGWQIILLRHTGDFQKSAVLGSLGPPRNLPVAKLTCPSEHVTTARPLPADVVVDAKARS